MGGESFNSITLPSLLGNSSGILIGGNEHAIIDHSQNDHQKKTAQEKPTPFKLNHLEIGLENSWFYYRSIRDYELSFISRRFDPSFRSVSIKNNQFLGVRAAAFANLFESQLSVGLGLSLRRVEYAFDAGFSGIGIACDGTGTNNYSSLSFREIQKWTEIPVTLKYTIGNKRPLISIFVGMQLHFLREAAYQDIAYEGVYYFVTEDPGIPCMDFHGDIFPSGLDNYSLTDQSPANRIKTNYSLFAGMESDFLKLTSRLSLFGQLTYGHLFKSWVNNDPGARIQNILLRDEIGFEEDDFSFNYLNVSLGVRYHFTGT